MERAYEHLMANGIETNLLIVDCSGNLDKGYFKKASVVRFINQTHPFKLDYFLKKYIGSELVWVSDDDCFIFDPIQALESIKLLSNSTTIASSFYPRPDWFFDIDGQKIRPMGSYCFLIRRDILIKGSLSFNILNKINPHNNRYYDTGDYLNETLLNQGYKINLPDGQKRSKAIGGFRGASIWEALAWGCGKRELETYFSAPYAYDHDYRHIIKSFYIADKVFKLNKVLFDGFKEEPLFTCEDIRKYVEPMFENNIKHGIIKDLEWVDESYEEIIRYITKYNKYLNLT